MINICGQCLYFIIAKGLPPLISLKVLLLASHTRALSFLPFSDVALEVFFHVFGCTAAAASGSGTDSTVYLLGYFNFGEKPEVTQHQIQPVRWTRTHCWFSCVYLSMQWHSEATFTAFLSQLLEILKQENFQNYCRKWQGGLAKRVQNNRQYCEGRWPYMSYRNKHFTLNFIVCFDSTKHVNMTCTATKSINYLFWQFLF